MGDETQGQKRYDDATLGDEIGAPVTEPSGEERHEGDGGYSDQLR